MRLPCCERQLTLHAYCYLIFDHKTCSILVLSQAFTTQKKIIMIEDVIKLFFSKISILVLVINCSFNLFFFHLNNSKLAFPNVQLFIIADSILKQNPSNVLVIGDGDGAIMAEVVRDKIGSTTGMITAVEAVGFVDGITTGFLIGISSFFKDVVDFLK